MLFLTPEMIETNCEVTYEFGGVVLEPGETVTLNGVTVTLSKIDGSVLTLGAGTETSEVVPDLIVGD